MSYRYNNLLSRLWSWIRLHKIRSTTILLVILLVIVLSQFGFVQVDTTGGSTKSENKVKLLNQKTLKATVSSTKTSTFKKLVRRGTYEVSVFSNSGTSFSINRVGGFLMTTKVSSNLKSENHSEFVGYSPKACASYNKNIAVSWGCVAGASSFTVHQPAIGAQPTYNQTNPYTLSGEPRKVQFSSEEDEFEQIQDNLNGTIEGIFEYNDAYYMLIKEKSFSTKPDQHVVYSLDNSYRPIKKTALAGLDPKKLYQVETLNEDILVYDTSMTDFLLYKTVNSQPGKLTFKAPSSDQVKPNIVKTSGSKVFILYNNYVRDGEGEETSDLVNIVVTIDGDKNYSHSFNDMFIDQFSPCGDGFCILSNGTLRVYNLSKSKPRYLYEIKQVNSVVKVGKVLLVSKPDGTVSLSIEDKSGYYGHTNNGLESCGIVDVHKDYYVDCVVDKYKRRSLISVDTTKNSSVQISKVVNSISKLDNVTGLSVYKNSIIITPDAGEFTYDKSIGGYGYDPSVQKKSISRVKSSIKGFGFDLSDYNVKIVGDN